jgi:hypothetical protein
MPDTLRTTVNAMADAFANAIIEAIEATSLADILDVQLPEAPTRLAPRHPKATARRATPVSKTVPASVKPASPEPTHEGRPQGTAEDVEKIVKYLRSHSGVTGEDARKVLGLVKNRWNTCVRDSPETECPGWRRGARPARREEGA